MIFKISWTADPCRSVTVWFRLCVYFSHVVINQNYETEKSITIKGSAEMI